MPAALLLPPVRRYVPLVSRFSTMPPNAPVLRSVVGVPMPLPRRHRAIRRWLQSMPKRHTFNVRWPSTLHYLSSMMSFAIGMSFTGKRAPPFDTAQAAVRKMYQCPPYELSRSAVRKLYPEVPHVWQNWQCLPSTAPLQHTPPMSCRDILRDVDDFEPFQSEPKGGQITSYAAAAAYPHRAARRRF